MDQAKWLKAHWQDWVWLAVIGLVVQAFWAGQLAHPSYMDAYYYTTNGRQLAEGHGFNEEIIWQYLDNPAQLPTPSHTYWMPLPSLVAALGYLFGDSFRLAQLPFWLMAGLLPVVAYLISQKISGERWQAWVAGLLTASGGFYARFLSQPSTFAPFALIGSVCLLLMASRSERPRMWLAVGLLAGLAHLTRADGILLVLLAAALLLWERHFALLPALFIGYLLAMGFWFAHNWAVMGRPLPTVGTQTIFLTTYDDLFAYGRSFGLSDYWQWGLANILQSKLEGLSLAVQSFIAINGLVFLTPFILWAWIKTARQTPFLRPFTLYALALFAVMALVFTFPGGRGGLFHSSAALWPWLMALAPLGISLAVDWTAVRLPHWQPERAKRLFSGLFVVVVFVMSLAVNLSRVEEERLPQAYEQIATMLPADAVVLVGDAPGFYYHTGRPSLSIPNESVNTLLQVAVRYHANYLVLDENRPNPIAALYDGTFTSPQIHPLADFDGIKLYQLYLGER